MVLWDYGENHIAPSTQVSGNVLCHDINWLYLLLLKYGAPQQNDTSCVMFPTADAALIMVFHLFVCQNLYGF